MNNIVYAGREKNIIDELRQKRKYWQFIRCGENGELISGNRTEKFLKSDIIAVPPLTDYTLRGESSKGTNGFCSGDGNSKGVNDNKSVSDIKSDGDIKKSKDENFYIFMDAAALPFKYPKTLKEESGGGFYHAFLQAERYFARNEEKFRPVLNALGELIIGYIIAQNERAQYSPVVESLRADIAANISNCTYSLEAFIRTMPLNYDYVRKLFKSEMGITPHEYLIKARMELARQTILSGVSNQYSKYSISQIAEMCGFSEPLYFSRVFKKYFGKAPSEYIK